MVSDGLAERVKAENTGRGFESDWEGAYDARGGVIQTRCRKRFIGVQAGNVISDYSEML